MSLVVLTVLLLILLRVAYAWYKFYETKRKLSWLPQVPGWPILGILPELKGSSYTLSLLRRFIKEYGKLNVTTALTDISITCTDYDFLEFILSSQSVITKSADYDFYTNWLGDGLIMSTGAKWKQRRRLITPAFHFSILKDFVPIFDKNVEIMVSKLKPKADKTPLDIYPYFVLCTLDIICETAMGTSMKAQEDEDNDYVKTVKEVTEVGTNRYSSAIKINDFLYRLTPDYYREKKLVAKLHAVTNSIIDLKMSELKSKDSQNTQKDLSDDVGQKTKKAFLDILVESVVGGQSLSREDIREEVDTFMFAGHDTTSTAASFTSYLLAQHPEIQERVFQEQAEIFADDLYRPTTNDDLPRMKYLENVLKESLRFYPPVLATGRKVTEDITYKGNIIPKGVNITIFTDGVLKDPDYFPSPQVFDPDRWESHEGKKPYAFIPFSAGPRNCIGQKFAFLELKTLMSKLIRNFELHRVEDSPPLELLFDIVVKSKYGMNVMLTPRKL